MQNQKLLAALALSAGLCASAHAAPVNMTQLDPGRTNYDMYSFFFVDGSRVPLASTRQELTAELTRINPMLKPCYVTGDLNLSNIRCGAGAQQMQLGDNELFTYDIATQLPRAPLDTGTYPNLKRGVNQSMVANMMTPVLVGAPGDYTGRVASIHFTGRMAEFGMLVDPGANQAVDSLQFIVNGQALPPQVLTGGLVRFVGVKDTSGFTDLTIIATGVSGTFKADQLTLLPLAKF